MIQSKKVTVISAQVECGMCPYTITGITTEGSTVYARYRWGLLSVKIDARDPPPFSGAAGVWILAKQIDPKGLDGWMTYEELKQHTTEIISWPDKLTTRSNDDGDDDTTTPDNFQL